MSCFRTKFLCTSDICQTLFPKTSENIVKEDTERLQEPDMVEDYFPDTCCSHVWTYSESRNRNSMHAVPVCTYGLIPSVTIVTACTQHAPACTLRLIASVIIMTACTISAQARAGQSPNMERGCGHKVPPLAKGQQLTTAGRGRVGFLYGFSPTKSVMFRQKATHSRVYAQSK